MSQLNKMIKITIIKKVKIKKLIINNNQKRMVGIQYRKKIKKNKFRKKFNLFLNKNRNNQSNPKKFFNN